MKTRVAITVGTIGILGAVLIAQLPAPAVKLTTVAYRVHKQQAMVRVHASVRDPDGNTIELYSAK